MSRKARTLPMGADLAAVRLLDEARLRQGLTQDQLGVLAGISQSQMSKYLAGERAMTLTEFMATCKALGLSAVDVIAEAEGLAD